MARQREAECASFSGPGVYPDPSAVPIDDLLANREPDTGTGVFSLVMQALEHHENPVRILLIEADAVVPHREDPDLVARLGADVDLRGLGAAKLHGVADEVLENLRELRAVSEHHRHRVVAYGGAARFLGDAQVGERLGKRRAAVDLAEIAAASAHAREREEILDQLLHA